MAKNTDQNTREHKMEILFATNPDVKVFYVTSDDQAFFNTNNAQAHAGSLVDKTVDAIQRPVVHPDEALRIANLEKKEAGKVDGAVGDLETLKAKYKEAVGIAAHHTWDAAKIQAKLNERKPAPEAE